MPYLNTNKVVELYNKFIDLAGVGKVVQWKGGVRIYLPVKVSGRHVKIVTNDTSGYVIVNDCHPRIAMSTDVRYIVYDDNNEWVGLRVYGNIEELLVRVYGSRIEPMEYYLNDPRAVIDVGWFYFGGDTFNIDIEEPPDWEHAFFIC